MITAMEAVQTGTAFSINQAARDYGVPPSTLKDRLSGRVIHGTKPGPRPYLSSQEENELETYLINASKVGYGKTRRQVIGNVATERGTKRKARVSDGWWRRYLQRHPKLSLRSGDATAHVRMDAINQENLKHYFSLLKKCIDENDLETITQNEYTYNMDESGVPLDPKPPNVVARKGLKISYEKPSFCPWMCKCNRSGTTTIYHF